MVMIRPFFPLFLFILCISYLQSTVFDHLKPIQNKSCDHDIKGIDFIYLINLDKRPEKYEKSMQQLIQYNIYPYRFSAVNGWEDLTLETINDLGVKWRPGMDKGFMATTYPYDNDFRPHHEMIGTSKELAYFCHCMSRGAIGCILSHLSVLKDAYDSNYETVWVMEDDIDIKKDPHEISKIIEELDKYLGKSGWDILFTDRDIKNNKNQYVPTAGYARRPNYKPNNFNRLHANKPIGKNFRIVGARFGSHSMVLRRSGIKKLLEFYKTYNLYHPYDMDYHVPEGMRIFTVLDDIVCNEGGAISDNGGPNYNK